MSLLYIHEEVEKLKALLDSMSTKNKSVALSVISKYSDPTKFMPTCSCCSSEHSHDFVKEFDEDLKKIGHP